MDKKAIFRFASLQSESGKKLLIMYGLPVDAMDTVIYIKEQQYFSESTAALEILKDLGGIWKLFLVFLLIPKKIRDSIYRFIASHRYRIFGKRGTCMAATPETIKRFL